MALKLIGEQLRYSHFSHKHPLEYTKLLPDDFTTCFGCKLKILPGNYYYKCKTGTCSFFLHQVCFNMPKNVNHPCDANHSLTLQSIPSLSSKVSIKCKACENQIKGFYYSCSNCIDYYHTLCLAAPLSIKAPSHHHLLNIEFSPLYDFECDLCAKPSYSGWLYHCNVCEFDAHLSCVLAQVLHQNHLSVEATMSTADPARVDKRDELLELLTRGAKNVKVGDVKDQMFLSEDPTMPSFQFSDACFSIDFEKSLLGSDILPSRGPKMGILEENEAEGRGRSSQSNDQDQSNEQSNNAKAHKRRSTKGIGSHIWLEMEQDTEKRLANGSVKGKSDAAVNSGCSSLPKLFVCFSNVRWNRETKAAANGGKNFR